MRNVSDFLEALGVGEVLSRKKVTYSEQATCQPEMRTVELPSNEPNSVFFPNCVRLPRCGGCCGLSEMLECVPTKISQKELTRARVRLKRSTSGKSLKEALPITIKVPVHEACKCKCKVQEDDCDLYFHNYDQESCKCVCKNQSEELACLRDSKNKVWDNKAVGKLKPSLT